MADSITYQQVQQDRNKQLAQEAIATPRSANPELQQAEAGAELPKFVRLPDGRIVPYGAGIVCTENCVEAEYIERVPARRNLWVWGLPLIAGGLIAGLIGSGVITGGGPVALVTTTPTPIAVTPTPVVTPTPPASEVPEPATLALLGLGLTIMARKGMLAKNRRNKQSGSGV